ncbi:MAG: SDR family oxidoreductase [Thermoleophilia bacterium]|nr:SDR family oxidoreductase [Thermoleophilia bacterium]
MGEDTRVASALVTGGSSGIGLAIAAMLHEEGFALTLAARGTERLAEAAAGLGALAVPTDVTDEAACAALVRAHADAHGGLDVLVNSAGVGMAGFIGATPTKRFDIQFAVNLRGAFIVTREALPLLRASRGLVVNLASIAGTIPTPGLAVYGASKAALISLSRSLAKEEAESGVRVTALCPAFVDTPMTTFTGLSAEEMIQPSDCAELVRSLLKLSPATRVPVLVVERAGDVV